MRVLIDEDNILSNKYPCEIYRCGIKYRSAESAFQASKFASRHDKLRFAKLPPFRAEYDGCRKAPDVPDWENLKYDYMYAVLKLRLSDPEFKSALLATGEDELVISNLNHEREWGTCLCSRCDGAGNNNLGRLLMQLRTELRSKGDDQACTR